MADKAALLRASVLAGLVTLASGTAATAQTTPAARSSDLDEVVVTALRREQRLKDVPVAVTALSQETLTQANIRDSRDLQSLTPGLRLEATGNYIQPTLRGVTTTLLNIANDSNVATYVDGVYQQANVGAVFDLPDVTSVQVLKGPQGTLFGRNATGGAILITSETPTFDTHGLASVSYGRFNEVLAKGFVSGPIAGETVAGSISAAYRRRDGYITDLRSGAKRGDMNSYVVRGKLRVLPWEGADFTLMGVLSRRHDPTMQTVSLVKGNYFFRGTVPDALIPTAPYSTSTDTFPDIITKTASASLSGSIEMGGGSLQTITAYTRMRMPYLLFDSDLGPIVGNTNVQRIRSNVFTQEVLYNTNPDKPLRATLGAFYFHFTGGIRNNVNNLAQLIYTADKTDAYAFFGEATYNVSEQLSLLAGARYSHETREANAVRVLTTGVLPAQTPRLGKTSFDSLTPRLSAIYKVTSDTNVYATFSKGFKSGAYNSSSLQAAPVSPEKITDYEVGMKTSGRSYNLNLAAFRYDYKDLQVGKLNQVGTAFVQVFENAARSKIYGVELEGALKVTDQLRLSGGIAYLHARYDSYPGAVVSMPLTTAPQPTGAQACTPGSYRPTYTGNRTVTCDVSGKTMVKSPDWSGSLNAIYEQPLNSGELTVSATIYASSRIYYDPIDRVSQAPYATLGARIAYRPRAIKGLELALYGTNLTDQRVLSGVIESTLWDAATYEQPRSVGVEARYSF